MSNDAITITDDLYRTLARRASLLADDQFDGADIPMRHRYSRAEYVGRKLQHIGAGMLALSTIAKALDA